MLICFYCDKIIKFGEYRNKYVGPEMDKIKYFHHSCFKIWKSRGFINPDGKFGSKCSASLGFADSGKAKENNDGK